MEYCKTCGAEKKDGICTKHNCPRRRIELKLKKIRESKGA